MEEMIQLCDKEGNPQGEAPRSVCHTNPSLIQMVVHLVIFNSRGEIFLQKRSPNKDSFPNFWDTSVGGHVSGGETLMQALKRESKEELGINLEKADFLFKHLFKMEDETELAFIYKTCYDGEIKIDNDEVVDGNFYSASKIRQMTGQGILTPIFEEIFKKVII